MTTTRIPLVAQINVTIVSQAVTAAYGSAGDLVNYSAACSSVLLRNPGEVWPIEFKVGSGAWQRLEIYNTTLLGISLDATTIRVRKALANSGSGLVQFDIRGLASTYLAGDDAVDLGGAPGGAAFTDLTDVLISPEDGILPYAVVKGIDAAGSLHQTLMLQVNETAGDIDLHTSVEGGGINIRASGEDGTIYLDTTTGDSITLDAGDSGVSLVCGALYVGAETAVATQSVLVAGVGTLVFTHGILTSFTPA